MSARAAKGYVGTRTLAPAATPAFGARSALDLAASQETIRDIAAQGGIHATRPRNGVPDVFVDVFADGGAIGDRRSFGKGPCVPHRGAADRNAHALGSAVPDRRRERGQGGCHWSCACRRAPRDGYPPPCSCMVPEAPARARSSGRRASTRWASHHLWWTASPDAVSPAYRRTRRCWDAST